MVLHKFRHTYATRQLQDGIDIRTLQQWMLLHAVWVAEAPSHLIHFNGARFLGPYA
jgi:site-specific recombinase XerC